MPSSLPVIRESGVVILNVIPWHEILVRKSVSADLRVLCVYITENHRGLPLDPTHSQLNPVDTLAIFLLRSILILSPNPYRYLPDGLFLPFLISCYITQNSNYFS
jgi:hypothetical protein